MGLYLTGNSSNEGRWGLWHIQESFEELKKKIPERVFQRDPILSNGNASKKLQRCAIRALLQELEPEAAPIHYEGSCPRLQKPENRISITHDTEFVAIHITRDEQAAGIDVQKRRPEQLEKVAPRFLNEKEIRNLARKTPHERTAFLNISWCAKEALYKASNSSLRDSMEIQDFEPAPYGKLMAQLIHPERGRSEFELEYRALGEHHLVHISDGHFL